MKLCKQIGKKVHINETLRYLKIVSKPKFVCLKYGRVAKKKKYLCKTEKIKDLKNDANQ